MPQSKTKHHISPETAMAFAKNCFGRDVLSATELGDGYYNTAFEIVFAGGDKVLLKIAPPADVKVMRGETALMENEALAMEAAAALRDFPVPKLIFHIEAEQTPFGSPCLFTEFINGVSYDKVMGEFTAEQNDAVYSALGRAARSLHNLTSPSFGTPQKPYMTWSTFFIDAIRDLLRDGTESGAELGMESDRILHAIIKHRATLDEVTVPVLVHRDMWFGNIFVDRDTAALRGIVDWERFTYGDPLMEFVFALIESFYPCKSKRAFYKAYGRPNGFSTTELLRVNMYNVYLIMLLIIEGYFRDYRNPEQEEMLKGLLEKYVFVLETQ